MSGDSRWCELMARPHTLDQTDVYEYVVQNAFLQARGTLPPSARASLHQSEDGSNKQSWKRGSVPDVILHSLYEEHAVRLLLFLWCRAAPVSGFDLKDLQESMSAGHVNTKLHDWSQARNVRDWEHFYPAHPLPRIMPGIRNRPPACTPTGMIFSQSQWSIAVEK